VTSDRPGPLVVAIASRNPHKIREITRIGAGWPVQWVTAGDDPAWPDVEETGSTYLDNALLKAEATARHTGVPALADDSGIEVDVLGGTPGPRSARFAGEFAGDSANLAKLIEAIAPVPMERRTARYRCVAVLARPEGTHLSAEATCEGTLITQPRGTRGFGYDPVFVPVGETRTMAELEDQEKDLISHRGRALRALAAHAGMDP
jgi:XTP/dITP diphosphohydrolase